MRRSKVFLGITTGLLAIAGIAAAKRYGFSKTRFFITLNSHSHCSPVNVMCTGSGTVTCFLVITDGFGNLLSIPTWTKGNPTQVVPVGPNACQGHKFTYDGVHL